MTRKKVYREPQKRELCGGKNVYETRAEAEKIARDEELIFANGGLELDVYKCAFCGGWHLTSHKNPGENL